MLRALYRLLSVLTLLSSASRGASSLAGTAGRRLAHRGLTRAMRRKRR